MDPVLLPYLSSASDSEREEHLDELILLRAAPLVRRILRRRLGLHVSDQGSNRDNHEAEDLYQETLTKIVQAVRTLRSSASPTEIEDFRGYVASITNHACADFLRAKSPAKYRLKHSVRDVFNRHQDFRTWKVDGEVVGGFAVWYGTDRLPASGRQVREFESELETFRSTRFPKEDVHHVLLTRIVAEVLQWIDRPIRIDDLADIVGLLLRIRDRPPETISFDETLVQEFGLGDNAIAAEAELAAKELLARVWGILGGMAPSQRDAYCFSFEDASGVDLFSLLLETEIASMRQIAEVLGRSVTEINRLRSLMPMDYAAIGTELGAPRSLVTQWRFRAIKRLKKDLGSK